MHTNHITAEVQSCASVAHFVLPAKVLNVHRFERVSSSSVVLDLHVLLFYVHALKLHVVHFFFALLLICLPFLLAFTFSV